jgi:phosphomannomutase
MKTLFLFDMDGTLTLPRQKISTNVELMLGRIQNSGHDVGIITGSGMNYVKQQCASFFDLSLLDTSSVHFLPCNGTKYILNEREIYSNNMKEYLGVKKWRELISFFVNQQNRLCMQLPSSFPLTGHFFDYRESMLNWCPIGRNADTDDRKVWESLDEGNRIRNPILKEVREFLNTAEMDLSVKLGGDTSFDIYPFGWDKTYPLNETNHFDQFEKIYFIGDRCQRNGNDFEIYNHYRTEGYQTDSVEQTCEIVNNLLNSNVTL